MNVKTLYLPGMLLLGFTLTQTLALAQSATLVKDINTSAAAPASSNPSFHSSAFTYFPATNQTVGTELYRTLGSTGGATLIKDINPGVGNAFPGSLHTVATTITTTTYFAASDGTNGRELWKTDGSTAGTLMVKDIVPGVGSSNPSSIVSIGTTIYFVLGSPGGKSAIALGAVPQPGELWKSDGTAAGTVLVKSLIGGGRANLSIAPVAGSSTLLFVMGTTLYLAADDGNGGIGAELWKSDGTTAGTVLVKDIYPGKATNGTPNSSFIQYFTAYKGKVYFYARHAASDYELWVTDGTTAGTTRVKDIRPGTRGSSPRYLTVFGSFLYFAANDGLSGIELWKSDGTALGTVLVKDIRTTTATASSSPFNNDPNINSLSWKFAVMGNAFYFRANDGINGTELWKSDGTAAGTVMVKDIRTGSSASPNNIVFDGNKTLYFRANDGINGTELWKSDGTAAGTVLVKDINTTTSTASSSPGYFIPALLGGVVFRANDGKTGNEPWFSDGTASGTKMVADINQPGAGDSGNSSPSNFAYANGTLFFAANNGTNGTELWKSDGTASGTVLVKDIRAGSLSSSPRLTTEMNGSVYFRASDGTSSTAVPPQHGTELWKSDGTVAGTVLVKDIRSGRFSSSPNNLAFDGQKTIYFSANDGSGNEFWKTDGTAAGTVLVKDINTTTSTASSTPNYITPLGNKVLFRASDGTGATNGGTELWVSDGTSAGTVMLKDIWPGATNGRANSSSPLNIYGGRGQIRQFAVLGNEVYFRANDGTNGTELWKSDGTAAGTVMMEINPSGSSTPQYITLVGSRHLFFQASDSNFGEGMGSGSELWMTDGSAAGTKRVTEINPADNNAAPIYLTLSGGKLFFRATDGRKGIELWMVDPGATGQSIGHGCPSSGAPTLSATDPVLGGSITVAAKGRPGASLALLAGLKNNPLATSLGFGCHLYVDPAKSLLFFFAPANDGSWKLTTNIPNNAASVGVKLMIQVGYGPSGTLPLGIDLSPGMKLTLGH